MCPKFLPARYIIFTKIGILKIKVQDVQNTGNRFSERAHFRNLVLRKLKTPNVKINFLK